MTLTADAVVDRRRTRRKLVFWRAVAFLAVLAALAAALAWSGAGDGLAKREPHIARIEIGGVIMADRERDEMLADLAADDAVKGVIVAIDSPGGSTTGGEKLYDGLRAIAAKKPTVATVGTLAASAGYMAAIATDHIVAQRTSITGSIGVYFQYGKVTELLKTIGVEVDTVKSAPLKAEPSPFTDPEVPGAREMIARLVDDTYQWFVDIVAERRGLDRATALKLADGSIWSGRQALPLKLVDEIGGEDEAIAWLGTRKVDTALPVLDWEPKRDEGPFGLSGMARALVADVLGFDAGALAPIGSLDGLVSVWQAGTSDLK